MAEWPHLSNAPITEALIDVRVELPDGFSIEQFAPFRDAIWTDYPECGERIHQSASVRLTPKHGVQVDHQESCVEGLVFKSADKVQMVQARLNGFTFHRLKPYQDWKQLRGQARELWNLYEKIVQPQRVTRIAVRYINRLELPLPMHEIGDWLRTLPMLAPQLPQQIAGYFMRVMIPFEPYGVRAILTQTIEPVVQMDRLPIVFDIDVFQEDPDASTTDALWTKFEVLRDIKNSVFFESVTEKTLGLYA